MDSDVFLLEWNRYEFGLRKWFSKAIFDRSLDVTYVDDFMQDTFLRAYSARESYNGGCFRAWLFRIGRNIWLDYKRKKNFDCSEELSNLTVSPDQEDFVVGLQLLEILNREIKSFPCERWAGILEGVLEEKTFKEIAEERGRAIGTIASTTFRIREYLRPSFF